MEKILETGYVIQTQSTGRIWMHTYSTNKDVAWENYFSQPSLKEAFASISHEEKVASGEMYGRRAVRVHVTLAGEGE